jgi:hypothetical protein
LQSEPSQALNETVTPFAAREKPQLFPAPAAGLIKNSQTIRDLERSIAMSRRAVSRTPIFYPICFY